MATLGGRAIWGATRYITWRFFGFLPARVGQVDRGTSDSSRGPDGGDDIHSREGRAFASGVETSDFDTLAARLEQGYHAWINDSYWLVMPYKLRTPASPCATGDRKPPGTGWRQKC